MTTTTLTRSAYPTAVDELIPLAREYAAELGKTPTRNQLMKRFRVGAPKARLILDALSPAEPEPAPPLTPVLIVEDEAQRYYDTDRFAAPAELDTEMPAAEPAAPLGITDATGAGLKESLLVPVVDPGTEIPPGDDTTTPVGIAVPVRRPVVWPVLLLALPAFVAIWAGWVELGKLTGFGKVNLLPGIGRGWVIDTAITLPIGVETYAAFALWVWLSGRAAADARQFAKWSAIGSLLIGALGQVAFHLMVAAGWDTAPWQITAAVACLPVLVLGMGAGLAHLMHRTDQ